MRPSPFALRSRPSADEAGGASIGATSELEVAMKLKLILVPLVAGALGSSLALAAPRDHGRPGGSAKTDEHVSRRADQQGDRTRCQQVELKGTVASGTLTIAVDKANRVGRALGASVSVAFGGKGQLHALLCQAQGSSAAGAPLQLRQLQLGYPPTPTTTSGTTTSSG
jgi:hypothetical protein